MTFHCQEGVVLFWITERFALHEHLPMSLGHPPALPRVRRAGSSPPRPVKLPADTLAKMLSLAAAGASFIAKVREPGAISPQRPCLPQAALCGAHPPFPTQRQPREQRKGGKPRARGQQGPSCSVGQTLQTTPNSAPQGLGPSVREEKPGMKTGEKIRVAGWWD